jgi:hypothetical protein
VGFILYYNLITPYFVRQHYPAVQLKMTVTPITWFLEKASRASKKVKNSVKNAILNHEFIREHVTIQDKEE